MLDEKGFDLWADKYDEAVGLSEERNEYPFAGYKKVLGTIFAEIMKRDHAKVLDLGFGTATLTSKLYDNGFEIWGQDWSRQMIEIAQAKMPTAKLFQGDFANGLCSELDDEKFDFIVTTYSFHHVPYGKKRELLQELLSHLSDSGMILIGDVAFENEDKRQVCIERSGEAWDSEEAYEVYEDLKKDFPEMKFEEISHCAGVMKLLK